MLERAALAALAILTIVFGYSMLVAADRFGRATEAFDEVTLDLGEFNYERGERPVRFTMTVSNPSSTSVNVVYVEYAFIVNGVQAGGGDLRPSVSVPPGGSEVLQLEGRINDLNYIERQESDEPLEWFVSARMQVNVDERLDSVFVPFSFRTETP